MTTSCGVIEWTRSVAKGDGPVALPSWMFLSVHVAFVVGLRQCGNAGCGDVLPHLSNFTGDCGVDVRARDPDGFLTIFSGDLSVRSCRSRRVGRSRLRRLVIALVVAVCFLTRRGRG